MATSREVASAGDRVLPATRALCAFIVPFLLVAFGLLYFWPSADDTGRLFAWRIVPDYTSMMLASAYLGGAYFFVRAACAAQWHRIAGGFLPVVLFSGLLGVATVLHWDRFIHTNIAFWLWAGLYFAAPLLVLLAWSFNRAGSAAMPVDEVLLSTPEAAVIAGVGVLSCVTAIVMFAVPGWAATVWPWPLTPLTARVVGAIFALGFAAVQVLADRRWTSARLLGQVALIMLALMTVAAARTLTDFAADRPLTWVMAVGLPGTLIGLAALYWRREFSRSGSRPAQG